MELYQLEYVLVLSQYMHFTEAAEQLHVSQSALSQGIKALEQELGVVLFDRTSRPVKLTAAGLEFLNYAKRIQGDYEDAISAMRKQHKSLKGKLRIGIIPVTTYCGLIPLLAEFQQAYPGISYELYTDYNYVLIRMLLNNQLDMAFLSDANVYEYDVLHQPFTRYSAVALMHRSNPLASMGNIHITDLKDQRIALTESMKRRLLPACFEAGFTPDIVLTGNRIIHETIVELVTQKIGIGIMSSLIAQQLVTKDTAVVELLPHITTSVDLVSPQSNRPVTVDTFWSFFQEKMLAPPEYWRHIVLPDK